MNNNFIEKLVEQLETKEGKEFLHALKRYELLTGQHSNGIVVEKIFTYTAGNMVFVLAGDEFLKFEIKSFMDAIKNIEEI